MYKGIGDEKNRINVISSSNAYQKKTVQSGAYEENILCAECDNNLLSKLERYANNYLYSRFCNANCADFEQITNCNGIELIRCKNIEYSQFKLFLQSLIWRASISNHPLFINFKLLPEDNERLRQSIVNLKPLEKHDFACVLMTPSNTDEVETDLVFINSTKPNKPSFFINQFVYLFFLDQKQIDNATEELILNYNNEMAVTKLTSNNWETLRHSVYNGVADITQQNIAKDNNASA
jgi:hypothetical protein